MADRTRKFSKMRPIKAWIVVDLHGRVCVSDSGYPAVELTRSEAERWVTDGVFEWTGEPARIVRVEIKEVSRG